MRNYICDVCKEIKKDGELVPYYYIDSDASEGNRDVDVCRGCRERLDGLMDKLRKDFRLLISVQMEAYLVKLTAHLR